MLLDLQGGAEITGANAQGDGQRDDNDDDSSASENDNTAGADNEANVDPNLAQVPKPAPAAYAAGAGGGDAGFLDIFGQSTGSYTTDFSSFTVDDEDKVYKSRELADFKITALPNNALGKRGWDVENTAGIAALDRSANDTLTKWWMMATDVTGDATQVLSKFHQDSQGLHRLDRHIGKLMCCAANLKNPMFGVQFATYSEWCQKQREAPRGRVFVAMVSLRFRVDRARGKTLNVCHLLSLKLEGYKHADVTTFVERVRLVLANLNVDEIKDKDLMYQWLFDQVKGWNEIKIKNRFHP